MIPKKRVRVLTQIPGQSDAQLEVWYDNEWHFVFFCTKGVERERLMIQMMLDEDRVGIRAEARKVCPCDCHLPALREALGIEEHGNCGLCAKEIRDYSRKRG